VSGKRTSRELPPGTLSWVFRALGCVREYATGIAGSRDASPRADSQSFLPGMLVCARLSETLACFAETAPIKRSFLHPIRLRGLSLPGTGRQPILASVASDFTDPVEWGLANGAGAVIRRAADMRADRRFRKSGRVQCGLRVIDGHQPGLAGRWRVGVASFSPQRLDFRRRWWRVLGECPPIEVFAVHGPPRAPSGDEILKLPGSVIQIQTPTATLEWALHERYQSAVIARLEIAHWVPAEETAE
jgi:hypothetical protein